MATQDKTATLIDWTSSIAHNTEELSKATYLTEAFTAILAQIQKTVDQLNLDDYSNLNIWVDRLNERIDEVLGKRLLEIIKAWCDEFRGSAETPIMNGDEPHSHHVSNTLCHESLLSFSADSTERQNSHQTPSARNPNPQSSHLPRSAHRIGPSGVVVTTPGRAQYVSSISRCESLRSRCYKVPFAV